jgi:hypothetical protein
MDPSESNAGVAGMLWCVVELLFSKICFADPEVFFFPFSPRCFLFTVFTTSHFTYPNSELGERKKKLVYTTLRDSGADILMGSECFSQKEAMAA